MATPAEHKAAERLEKRESVQFALDQARGEENPAPPRAQAERRDRAWLTGWLAILAVTATVYFLSWRQWWPLAPDVRDLLLRVTRGVMLAAGILAAVRLSSLLLIVRLRDPVSRYNLHRIADLLSALAAAFVAQELLRRLNGEPERAKFPKSNLR